MGVSINGGTPTSILMGFSFLNHPVWVPPFMETPILDSTFEMNSWLAIGSDCAAEFADPARRDMPI